VGFVSKVVELRIWVKIANFKKFAENVGEACSPWEAFFFLFNNACSLLRDKYDRVQLLGYGKMKKLSPYTNHQKIKIHQKSPHG
jgi:hypothetical protein